VGEIWNQEKQARAKAEQEHVRWLTSVDDGRNESGTGGGNTGWIPTGPGRLLPPIIPEEIDWGSSQPRRGGSVIQQLPSSAWDEYGSLAFDYARSQQEAQRSPLSHLELDVEGKDAHGRRVRVQKFLEIWLDMREYLGSGPASPHFERSVMKMKHICILRAPHPQAFPVLREEEREPAQVVLERLAQNEVDKVLDERNHFLRDVFANEEEHVREMRDILAHNEHEWTFGKPEVAVRGADETVLLLREGRADVVADGCLTLTHVVVVEQTRMEGRTRLFDLPADGSESERKVRRARWSISSAIDRCIARGSGERFVMDKWVDRTFRPRA